MTQTTNYVKNFTDAIGSAPDNESNIAKNAIDVYDTTRFSSNEDKAFFEGIFNKEVKNIVAIDIGFSKERKESLYSHYHIHLKLDQWFAMLMNKQRKNTMITPNLFQMVM